jgi:dynein heavy chain
VSKVRENLHIVLSFNPIGATFRERVRMFPSLVNNCAIDWFQPWPQDALIEVAIDKFSSFRLHVGTKEEDDNYIKMIIEMCPYIHNGAKKMTTKFANATKRNVYITPKNFLDLIEN